MGERRIGRGSKKYLFVTFFFLFFFFPFAILQLSEGRRSGGRGKRRDQRYVRDEEEGRKAGRKNDGTLNSRTQGGM